MMSDKQDSSSDSGDPEIREPAGFDNTPITRPSRWEMVKSHAPLLIVGGGIVALFISLHTAAIAVAAAAAGHLVLGLAIMAFGWWRNRRTQPSTLTDKSSGSVDANGPSEVLR